MRVNRGFSGIREAPNAPDLGIKEFHSESGACYWAGFNLVWDASAPIPSLGR